jgi:hypothetical protein
VKVLDQSRYTTAEFVDDYRLLVSLESTVDAPPSLVLMDTRKNMGGKPMQTFLHLSSFFINAGPLGLLFERGTHEPSPAESQAPFYQDPSQRIVVLDQTSVLSYLVLRVGALLEFVESREGSEIEWDEWKSLVAIPFVDLSLVDTINAWVSGSRFFFISSFISSSAAFVRLFDFSMRGRAKYLSGRANERFGDFRALFSTGAKAEITRDFMLGMQSGHDSIVFARVSVLFLLYYKMGLNGTLHCAAQSGSLDEEDDDDDDESEYAVHI